MRLDEALQQLEENKNYIATYDELMYTLDKAIEGKVTIPVDTEKEIVPVDIIRQVKEHIGELRSEHLDRIRAIEGLEVTNVR